MKKFVRSRTLTRLKTLQAALRLAAHEPKDAEAIHDLRVAIRRFVQCLRAFEQFFEPSGVKKIRKRLQKLMDQCGAARNCDIAIELLAGAGLGEDPAIAALRQRRGEAEATLVKSLARWRKEKIRQAWRSSLKVSAAAGDWNPAASAAVNAATLLPCIAQSLFDGGDAAARDGAPHAAMHRFRLQAKRFRYTLELFEGVYSEAGMRQSLADMKGLQDKLGYINDCVTASALLAAHRPAVQAVAGLLPGREDGFRSYWRRRFGPTARKRWNQWLAAPEEE